MSQLSLRAKGLLYRIQKAQTVEDLDVAKRMIPVLHLTDEDRVRLEALWRKKYTKLTGTND